MRKGDFDASTALGSASRAPTSPSSFVPTNLPLNRFGFSIKKALGGAVVRNRIRRRLREMVRCHRQEIPAGWDIVIHPKSSVAKAPFAALTAGLVRLLKKL